MISDISPLFPALYRMEFDLSLDTPYQLKRDSYSLTHIDGCTRSYNFMDCSQDPFHDCHMLVDPIDSKPVG